MGDHLCIGPDLLAVWTGGTDTDPVDDPDSHADRLRFHSLKENLGFIHPPFTGTVNVGNWPASGSGADRALRRNLFEHGLGYRPLLLGYLTINGNNLPIQGTIVHRQTSGGGQWWYGYTIGSDSTHVYLNQLRFIWHLSGGPTNPSISYTIWCSSYGANTTDDGVHRPPYFNGVESTSNLAKAGHFSTDYRYPYEDPSGFPLITGPSISLGVGSTYNQAPYPVDASGLGWRYSVDGYVAQRNATPVSTSITGFLPGNDSAYNAPFVRIKL
jgi:hypothetical protein